MSKSYESLTGAAGKARFFRPRRYDAAGLFAGLAPQLVFEDEVFELRNLSATGAGCVRRRRGEGPEAPVGASGILRLTQAGRELFLGAARKVRADDRPGGQSVGFALEANRFDLDWLIRENASLLAQDRRAVDPAPEAPEAYKLFCADVTAFLGGHLLRIQKHISPIEDRLDDAARGEIARDLAGAAESAWLDLVSRGNELAVEAHDNKQLRLALKAFTERTVTQALLAGPGWARCYFKPAGYPGDYQIMNYGYDQRPEGESVGQKFLHLLGMSASRFVITRMETIARLVADYALARRTGHGDEFVITSVGSGPARELEDLLALTPEDVRFRVNLVDQEPAALDFAYARVAAMADRDRVSLAGLNISFREMLRPSPDNAAFAGNDVIYSSGLVDYLNPLLAQRFLMRLYEFVRPGGQVIIGNVNNLPTGAIWPLEYVTDWTLYFRSEADMVAMAREIPGARISVISDPLETIYFLVVEKPAD